jgi:hypothetical protein
VSPADLALDARPLDLHEGICDPLALGCRRWPEHLRLLNHSTGELLPGRCKATNLCDYCARLFAVETSEMLLLDACEDAPGLYVVLTARELLTRRDTYDHLRQLRKAARKRWPEIRWAVLVEFQRRGALHLNLLVKGVPVEDAAALHEVLASRWCDRVDAEPHAQFVGEVSDGAGLVRYISLHFLKPGQAPPRGWRGHRYSSTRDYLVRPASAMREEARSALRIKRRLWRGLTLEEAHLEEAVPAVWSLRQVAPLSAHAPASVRGQRLPPAPARSRA